MPRSLFAVVVLILFTPSLAFGQSDYVAPRTEYGVPDLQGLWEKRFATPVERPEALGDKRAYTEAEAAEFRQTAEERRYAREAPVAADRGAPPAGGDIEFRTDTNFLPDQEYDLTSVSMYTRLFDRIDLGFQAQFNSVDEDTGITTSNDYYGVNVQAELIPTRLSLGLDYSLNQDDISDDSLDMKTETLSGGIR